MKKSKPKVEFNAGDYIDVTPTAFTVSDTISVTIDNYTYSIVGTGTLSTTIDSFISQHRQAIGMQNNAYISNENNVIRIYNLFEVRFVSATNATVSTRNKIEEQVFINPITSTIVLSGTTITIINGIDISNSYSKFELEFSSEQKAIEGKAFIDNAIALSTRTNGVVMNMPCVALFLTNAILTQSGLRLTTEQGQVITTEQE